LALCLQPAVGGRDGERRGTQGVSRPGLKGHLVLLPTFHRPECRHLDTPHCKKGWELRTCCVAGEKRSLILIPEDNVRVVKCVKVTKDMKQH
jgi:hypothetical protein